MREMLTWVKWCGVEVGGSCVCVCVCEGQCVQNGQMRLGGEGVWQAQAVIFLTNTHMKASEVSAQARRVTRASSLLGRSTLEAVGNLWRGARA